MFLKLLHKLGLTDLSDRQVRRGERKLSMMKTFIWSIRVGWFVSSLLILAAAYLFAFGANGTKIQINLPFGFALSASNFGSVLVGAGLLLYVFTTYLSYRVLLLVMRKNDRAPKSENDDRTARP